MTDPEPFGYFQFDLRLDAWVLNRDNNKGVAFYTAPPKKEWVGLTDEEIRKIDCIPDDPVWQEIKDFTRAIEAKLKEKNSG